MIPPNVDAATATIPVPATEKTPQCITDEYAGRNEAATYLRVCKKTLERWQAAGTGPAVTKIGRTVYYRWETLRAWVASRECRPTHNPISLKR
jgi:hypothetical protein